MGDGHELTLEDRRACVVDVIGRQGMALEDLTPHVSRALGEPVLAVVTGSIVAGYGNAGSDLDIYVAARGAELVQLPIVALDRGLRIDVRYFSIDELEQWPDDLRAAWPVSGAVLPRRATSQRWRLLSDSIRFVLGVPLLETAEGSAWKAQLEGPHLRPATASFWQLEAMRRLAAAILLEQGTVSSDYRYSAALVAALNYTTSELGHIYFGEKWLPEKLRAIGDELLLERFRRSFRHPLEVADRNAIVAYVHEIAGPPSAYELQLHLAPGVAFYKILTRTFVSRWQLRSIELTPSPPFDPASASAEKPLWRAQVSEPVPPLLLQLLDADMLWLSVAPTRTTGCAC